ncbi:MAG: Kae1-associated serine/threonine protein kinase [Thermoproteota archaeon]|nr:Kae1-associated serine/threonine protein kinase [Thermoproteota archaeon]MDQ3806611.1 Kae1-associated serine/threonine protein kinase [Thermoproteota archaeon]MDQ3883753.1 Kae1-associated serine/threonine protein kinase [Thermoproteota archaeon]
MLIKRGAEADIYIVEWDSKKAISKVRSPKPYRHPELDSSIRKHRTIHEATFMSTAKAAGVMAPFVYFVDPGNAEIIMEFVEGQNVRDVLTPDICYQIGRCAALLHTSKIIHGDLTTSNFVMNKGLVLLDFGLSYYSERIEDMATDIRLIKEVFTSAHIAVRKAFPCFVEGYAKVAGRKRMDKILVNVRKIEQRGRYARMT